MEQPPLVRSSWPAHLNKTTYIQNTRSQTTHCHLEKGTLQETLAIVPFVLLQQQILLFWGFFAFLWINRVYRIGYMGLYDVFYFSYFYLWLN